MKGADDDVEGDPGDEEPAGPVAAVKHEDAGDDLQNPRKLDVPVALEIPATHYTAEQRHSAEYNEKPTDDCDRSRALWHVRPRY